MACGFVDAHSCVACAAFIDGCSSSERKPCADGDATKLPGICCRVSFQLTTSYGVHVQNVMIDVSMSG